MLVKRVAGGLWRGAPNTMRNRRRLPRPTNGAQYDRMPGIYEAAGSTGYFNLFTNSRIPSFWTRKTMLQLSRDSRTTLITSPFVST